jgi:UDPglucose 6-dehydrogenase
VRASEIIFIAVGTPPDEDGSADLQHVLEVAETIGRSMNGEKVVVTKSTVPVGTAARVRAVIQAQTRHPVHVCSNPEFLKEGAAVDDFMKPDRVVIGVDSEFARSGWRSCTRRSCARAIRCCSWTCRRLRSRSTRQMRCSPRASPS